MITRIRVPATWANPAPGLNKRVERAVADFTLGVGTCGKTVRRLDCEARDGFFIVEQECSDDERKFFMYPISTLTGRVEITENSC